MGELALTPTSFNTWESRPCTSPGQHNGANPVGTGVGEPGLSSEKGGAVPILICHVVAGAEERCPPLPLPRPSTSDRGGVIRGGEFLPSGSSVQLGIYWLLTGYEYHHCIFQNALQCILVIFMVHRCYSWQG